MSNFKLMLSITLVVVLAAFCAAPALCDDDMLEDRVLIKLGSAKLSSSLLNLPLLKGASLPVSKTGIQAVDSLVEQYGEPTVSRPYSFFTNKSDIDLIGQDRWFEFRFDYEVDVVDLRSQLLLLSDIEAVDLVYWARTTAVPQDALFEKNWGHNNTQQLPAYNLSTNIHDGSLVGTQGFDANIPAAWDFGYGDWLVTIAIIDTGFDLNHPDISYVDGWDTGDGDDDPSYGMISDGNGNSSWGTHGTACAGIAGAIVSENIADDSVAGVAGGCRIMPIKVWQDVNGNSGGGATSVTIADGILWAALNGADVISLSLSVGGNCLDPDTQTGMEGALLVARNNGIPVFAASGNENLECVAYPASSQYVISVGAASPCGTRKRASSSVAELNPNVRPDTYGVSCDNEVWWGSSYGNTYKDQRDSIDLLGPTILPTTDIVDNENDPNDDIGTNGSYELYFNGTSCSAPYVAGVAALIKSQNRNLDALQVRDILTSTAIDMNDGVESEAGWDRYTGYGLVDASMAVAVAGSEELSMVFPHTNSVLELGEPFLIMWSGDETYPVISQQLEISIDGSAFVQLDAGSGAISGGVRTYLWTPTIVTDNCVIRVSATWSNGESGGTHQAASDVFRVRGDYRVISGTVKMPAPWSVGVAGVRIYDGETTYAVTDDEGLFTFIESLDWTGVLHAEKLGNAFELETVAITDVEPRDVSVSFIMEYIAISGVINGEMSLLGITVNPVDDGSRVAREGTTDAGGAFVVWVEHGWSGDLVPSSVFGAIEFLPELQSVAFVELPIGNIVFAATNYLKWNVDPLVGRRVAQSNIIRNSDGTMLVPFFRSEGSLSLPDHTDLMVQKLSAAGEPLYGASGQIILNDVINAPQLPSIGDGIAVGDGIGGAYVLWGWQNYTGGPYNTSYCHISSDGYLLGSPSTSLNDGGNVSARGVLADGQGGFYVAYVADGSSYIGRREVGTENTSWDLDVGVDSATRMQLVSDGNDGVIALQVTSDGSSSLFHLSDLGVFLWQNPIVPLSEECVGIVSGPGGGVYAYGNQQGQLIGFDGSPKWGVNGYDLNADELIADGDGGLIVKRIVGNIVRVDKIDLHGNSMWGGGIDALPVADGQSSWLCSNGDGGAIVVAGAAGGDEFGQEVSRAGSLDWGNGLRLLAGGAGWINGVWSDGRGGIVASKKMKLTPNQPGIYDTYLGRINNVDEQSYEVRGVVSDTEGRGKLRVTVVAREVGSGTEIGFSLTDENGEFQIDGISILQEIEVVLVDVAVAMPQSYHFPKMDGDKFCGFEVSGVLGGWDDQLTAYPLVGQYKVTNAVEMADFDGDGTLDMYISYGEAEVLYRYTAANRLLTNGGGGAFSQLADPGPADGFGWTGPTISALTGDMDNDGDQDIYLCNGDQFVPSNSNILLENDMGPNGVTFNLADTWYSPEIEDQFVGGKADWIDLNSDGFLDLCVGRPGQTGLVFRGYVESGDVSYQSVTVPGFTDIVSNGFSSWADFNNDGLVDVLVFGDGGNGSANYLMVNNGDWSFTDITTVAGIESELFGASTSAAWGDYDNDGDVDLFMNFTVNSPKRLLRNDGTSYPSTTPTFTDITETVSLFASGEAGQSTPSRYAPSSAIAWSDIDNDGDLDLLLSGQPTEVWENRLSDGVFVRSTEMNIVSTFCKRITNRTFFSPPPAGIIPPIPKEDFDAQNQANPSQPRQDPENPCRP